MTMRLGRGRSLLAVALVGVLTLVVPAAANAAEATNIPVGEDPVSVAVAPDGSAVYVAQRAGKSVSRITNPTAANPTVTNIPLGVAARSVAVSPGGDVVYTANDDTSSVSRITNPTSVNPTVTTFKVGNTPLSVAVSPDGSAIYTANIGNGTLSRITNLSAAIPTVTTIPLGKGPYSVAVSPDGSTVYAAHLDDKTISRITNLTAATPTVTSLSLGVGPIDVAVSPDGKTLYTANYYAGSVSRVTDLSASNPTVSTIPLSSGVYSVAVSPDGNTIYAANLSENTVSQITDLTTANPAVTKTVVGKTPFSVAVSPDGASFYTANSSDNTVSRVSLPTFTPPTFKAAAPPAAAAGSAYSYTFIASGSPAPTFSVASGDTLPSGLTLNSATGELSGAPAVEGSSTFRVVAANSAGTVTSDVITFSVQKSPMFTAATPPTAEVGEKYSYTFTAAGYPAPSYSVATDGTLPDGLTLDATTGELSGILTTAGTSTFRVVAANAAGTVTSDLITFSVYEEPAFTRVAPSAALVGSAYSYTFAASGYPAPSFSVATGDVLPAGLSLNATTGALSGTPTTAGTKRSASLRRTPPVG